jgi:hypothetical protein
MPYGMNDALFTHLLLRLLRARLLVLTTVRLPVGYISSDPRNKPYELGKRTRVRPFFNSACSCTAVPSRLDFIAEEGDLRHHLQDVALFGDCLAQVLLSHPWRTCVIASFRAERRTIHETLSVKQVCKHFVSAFLWI